MKNQKIVVLNFSGNVGKTTICDHVLKANMKNSKVFSVESINQGSNDSEVEQVKGKRFGELIDSLMMIDSAIVDVGASNVEDFLKYMEQYDGSHEDFDLFVVPVTKEKKAQQDTINTIKSLNSLGIPKEKISVVFNKLDSDDSIEGDFISILGFHMAEKLFTLNNECVVYLNEVFERLRAIGKTLGEVKSDKTDYKAHLRDPKIEDKSVAIQMIALQRLAKTADRNLRIVFENLT